MGSERRGADLSHPSPSPSYSSPCSGRGSDGCSAALVEGQAVSGSCDPREFQEEAGHMKLDGPAGSLTVHLL